MLVGCDPSTEDLEAVEDESPSLLWILRFLKLSIGDQPGRDSE